MKCTAANYSQRVEEPKIYDPYLYINRDCWYRKLL